ncbi:hypothetical protein AN403_133 [Pseudomonas fluorescens]|uniref:Uncharacterized protein n=1 Tax=Pseudomonas fluorescens TaxID=294 RepID=A0A0P9AM35_PSEFL|nr:hypothetical protein AN403_133 [Pseudomonas fluorescens]
MAFTNWKVAGDAYEKFVVPEADLGEPDKESDRAGQAKPIHEYPAIDLPGLSPESAQGDRHW